MTEPPEVAQLRARIDRALADFLSTSLPRLSRMHPALEPLADELRGLVLAGGKRLRPVFAVVGYRAAGGTEPDRVMGPALALELLHTCALVHDDIIDAAPTRRGRPTTHARFADTHRSAGWGGEPDSYGQAVAILLGDLAFVLADELFRTGQVPHQRLLDGLEVFTLLREEVMAGQYLDLYASRSGRTERALALRVASYKAGRYTVARPLQLGAVLAGAPADLVEGLLALGLPLGQAFQLRDDILGVFGAEAETGKSAASDLAEGKRTVLIAETAARLDAAGRHRLEALLGRGHLSAAEAAELRDMIRESGGLAATQALVDDLIGQALSALGDLDLDRGAARTLEGLATFVAHRRG